MCSCQLKPASARPCQCIWLFSSIDLNTSLYQTLVHTEHSLHGVSCSSLTVMIMSCVGNTHIYLYPASCNHSDHTYITDKTRQHHSKLVLWHAQDTLLGLNTIHALLLLVLMIACDSRLARAESAFLPSTTHTQSTTSRRTGRGDACVSLGCVAALKICNGR